MTSNYEDIFEAALAAVRQDADIDAVVSRYPRHASRLREDLRVALTASELRDQLPAPDAGAAWSRLQRDLATARSQRASKAASRAPFWRSLVPVAALAVGLAVAFIALSFFSGRGTDEASAATLEGIVLENADGTLTLQTADGIETITVDEAAATLDGDGEPLQATAIETGQMVLIRGQRVEAGAFVVARMQLGAQEAMRRWCAENPIACREVDRLLNQYVERCQEEAVACERIRNRLRDLTQDLPQIIRLDEIRARCEQADTTACQELRGFCDRQPDICRAAFNGIIKRTDADPRRLRGLSESCLDGQVLACRQLREACQEQNLPCPTPIIQRSVSTPETIRPLLQPTTPARPADTSPTPQPTRPTATPTIPVRPR